MCQCYVCSKEPTKRCTSCFQIAYCGVGCQKSDWKYHKNSCLQKTINVIDSLIKLQNFDHILRDICQYLSGEDLHHFRCVKRSWRDVVLDLENTKIVRKSWEQKLAQQWKKGSPTIRTVMECPAQITKIAVSGSELFVEILEQAYIKVYDVTTNKLKYSLPSAGSDKAWDVHKDFLVVFDGSKFYVWDRHRHEEVETWQDTYMTQFGTHLDTTADNYCPGAKHDNILLERDHPIEQDHPVYIKIFSNEVWEDFPHGGSSLFVVYKSGITARWTYRTPYAQYWNGDFYHTPKVFMFRHAQSTDYIKQRHMSSSDKVFVSQPCFGYDDECHDLCCLANDNKCNEFCLRLEDYYNPRYIYSQLILFNSARHHLELINMKFVNEGDTGVIELDYVEQIYCYYDSNTLNNDGEGYLILKKKFNFVQFIYQYEEMERRVKYERGEYDDGSTFESWKNSHLVQDDDDELRVSYIEIHTVNPNYIQTRHPQLLNLRHCMKVCGLVEACQMNDQHTIIAVQLYPHLCNHIDIYDTKDLIVDGVFPVSFGLSGYTRNPKPIRVVRLDKWHIPMHVSLGGPNRLAWVEDIDDYEFMVDHDYSRQRDTGIVKFVNFWMA